VIDGLSKYWGDTLALSAVSFRVAPGEVVAVLGASGSGKSTLFRCAARLSEPSSGRVSIGGVELTAAETRRRGRGAIGVVFQQFNLVPSHSALTNVLLGRLADTPGWRGLFGLFSAEDRRRAGRALDDVGLADKANCLVRELSGGQQQRVAVARVFAQAPVAVFADEPTSSLDPLLSDTVLKLLRDYGQQRRVPVLMNLHSVESARKFADRVLGLRGGELVADLRAVDLTANAVARIYGAPAEVSP